jgi:hypothetical protein
MKGKEVTHSPRATQLVERRRSGAVDNFHLQKRHLTPKNRPIDLQKTHLLTPASAPPGGVAGILRNRCPEWIGTGVRNALE